MRKYNTEIINVQDKESSLITELVIKVSFFLFCFLNNDLIYTRFPWYLKLITPNLFWV